MLSEHSFCGWGSPGQGGEKEWGKVCNGGQQKDLKEKAQEQKQRTQPGTASFAWSGFVFCTQEKEGKDAANTGCEGWKGKQLSLIRTGPYRGE